MNQYIDKCRVCGQQGSIKIEYYPSYNGKNNIFYEVCVNCDAKGILPSKESPIMERYHSFATNLNACMVDSHTSESHAMCSTCHMSVSSDVQISTEIPTALPDVADAENVLNAFKVFRDYQFFLECEDCKKNFCSMKCVPKICTADDISEERKAENAALWEELEKLPKKD